MTNCYRVIGIFIKWKENALNNKGVLLCILVIKKEIFEHTTGPFEVDHKSRSNVPFSGNKVLL